MVHLKEKTATPNELEYTFYLGLLIYQSNEGDISGEQLSKQSIPFHGFSKIEDQNSNNIIIPKAFAKLLQLVEFDKFLTTHGPGTDLIGNVS